MLVSVRGANGSPGRAGRRNRGPAPSFSSRSSVAFISSVDLASLTAMAHTVLTARAKRGEQLAIARVAEEVRRAAANAEPSDGVDLVARLGVAVGRHRPVANGLRTPARVAVGDRGQLRTERAAQAGLLPHLAERALLVRLARLALALGEGPIPVVGTVDQQHLDLAALVAPRDHAARRPHHAILRHVRDLGLRVCARALGCCPDGLAHRLRPR